MSTESYVQYSDFSNENRWKNDFMDDKAFVTLPTSFGEKDNNQILHYFKEENSYPVSTIANQESFLDKVFDVVVGIPLDLFRAKTYVTGSLLSYPAFEQAIFLFTVAGSTHSRSGPTFLSKDSMGLREFVTLSTAFISGINNEDYNTAISATIAASAAINIARWITGLGEPSLSPAPFYALFYVDHVLTDYLVNHTFLSDYSYFDFV